MLMGKKALKKQETKKKKIRTRSRVRENHHVLGASKNHEKILSNIYSRGIWNQWTRDVE